MNEDQNARERYIYLAGKWLEGSLSQEEEQEFNAWYDKVHEEPIHIDPDHALSEEQLKEELFDRIQKKAGILMPEQDEVTYGSAEQKETFSPKTGHPHFLFSKRVAVFLFAIALCSVIGYYSKKEALEPARVLSNTVRKRDILPGTEKAILTLASGRKLLLDSTASGILALQGNLRVMASPGGLTYIAVKGADSLMQHNGPDTTQSVLDEDRTTLEIQNTLATPRGARYHLTLSDGTKVWINAASSITFPVSFRAHERQVAIKGEAYFEVAKNAARPFKVTVDEMEVTVLGTHFNINAYRDESTLNTTLLEGAVKVRNLHNGFSKIIRPGQQAKLYATDEIKVASVDTGLATAWKNGLFQFEKADLHTLLNEVSRWYNIQIEWKGTGSPDLFTGTIPRNLKLSELLSVLEYANVRFKLTSNKLIVYT